jgi:hypothetical protein
MKKLFKNGWWYALFTFVVPFVTLMLIEASSFRDAPLAQVLLPICSISIAFNMIFGPTMQAYWRRNVSFRGILILNIAMIFAGFFLSYVSVSEGGRGFLPLPALSICLWLWVWCGKVKVPVEKIASFEKCVPDLDLSSSFVPAVPRPVAIKDETRAATGTPVPSRYYARLNKPAAAQRADDHLYYY